MYGLKTLPRLKCGREADRTSDGQQDRPAFKRRDSNMRDAQPSILAMPRNFFEVFAIAIARRAATERDMRRLQSFSPVYALTISSRDLKSSQVYGCLTRRAGKAVAKGSTETGSSQTIWIDIKSECLHM